MALITLLDAQLAFGHVALLDKTSFSLEPNERIGLIGRNGAGKSSLLKIIGGLGHLDDGVMHVQQNLSIAYVAQEPILDGALTVFDSVSLGLKEVVDAVNHYISGDMPVDQMDALQNLIEQCDGWNWEQRVEEAIERLQLPHDALIATLSGGTKKRVALAQALVTRPDVLLLDEPTNHLDMTSIQWLEDLLVAFSGSVISITHDRSFLDATSTRIVELDRGILRSYPGNFSTYVLTKEQQLADELVTNAKADKLLAQEEVWIRKGVEARRTRAQGRITRLENLRLARESRRDTLGQVKLDVASGNSSGKIVAELENVSHSFGDKVIVTNFTATVLRGDKIGLIAPNGAGKTTLLKIILGELQANAGRVRQGSQLSVAYFDQMRASLDLDATLEDFISPGSEWIEIGAIKKHVKSYLSDFLFSPARALSPVRSLSGGERNRLLLARLFARPANVLVLDEPTNDLDIDTLELLEELLTQYPGTVFLVSHDRAFLNNVVTSTLVFEGNGHWREFEGDVNDWLIQSKRMQTKRLTDTPIAAAPIIQTPREQLPAAPLPAASASNLPKKKLSYKEQRELDALPALIAALEAEQSDIRTQTADGSIYSNDAALAQQLLKRDAQIDDELMQALERWDALGS